MRRVLIGFFVGSMLAGSSSVFARENIPADVASPGQLSVDGGLNGVSLTGLTTLLVGTSGGLREDIFTSNTALATVPAAVSSSSNLQGTVVFNSSSTVNGDMGASGTRLLYIQIMAGSTVNFLGSVYAGTLDTATGSTNFKGPTNIVATNFTGDGTISLASNATLAGALTTNTADTGTLSLGSASQLTGAVGGADGLRSINVTGASSSAGVNAAIVGAVNTYAFNLGVNTLNINGTLTLETNGVIDTILASPSVFGHVVVSGGSSNLGTGLAVDVNVPATSLIKVGDQFNIVQGSGTGALATVTDVSNPLYKFSIVTSPTGQATIQTSSTPVQSSSNPVVPVLLAIPITPGLGNIITSINALSDPAAVISAVAQLSPSAAALAVPFVTFQGAREFENLWLSRLDLCSQYSQYVKNDASCRENNPQSGWWAKGFGYFGNQDNQASNSGYDSVIAGTMIAYDKPLGLDTRVGLGLGYARSTINENEYSARMGIDTYQTTAYIGHEDGPWYINASQSLGFDQYRGVRDIIFPGVDLTAKSGYTGQDYTTYVNTGFHIPAPWIFTFTPLVSLQYSRVNVDSYTETGAGDVNLHVKPQGYDFLESGLGGKVEHGFNLSNWTLVPDLHFKWFYDFINPTMAQTAQFTVRGSSSFYSTGLKTDPNLYDVGAGMTFLSCACNKTKISIDGAYDYFWRNDGFAANQFTMRVTLGF